MVTGVQTCALPIYHLQPIRDRVGGGVTILFFVLLCLGMVLLVFSATPVSEADLTWCWYAGIGCVAVAALIAALNGWAT